MKKYYFRLVALQSTPEGVRRMVCGPVQTSLADVVGWDWGSQYDPRDPVVMYTPRKEDFVTTEAISPAQALEACWASAAEWRRRQADTKHFDLEQCAQRIAQCEKIATEAEKTLGVCRVDEVPDQELHRLEVECVSHLGYSRGYHILHDLKGRCYGDSYHGATWAVVWQYEIGKHHHRIRTWKMVGAWVTPQADLAAVAAAIVHQPK